MARYELPYKKIQGVYFQPWRGGQYAQHWHHGSSWSACRTIGVTSKSRTSTSPIKSSKTGLRTVIEGLSSPNIVATCTCNDELPSQEAKIEFWHSIAFYSDVQEFVGQGPRTPHPQRLWSRSHDAFGAALRSLNPELIMVVGDTNWKQHATLQCRVSNRHSNTRLNYSMPSAWGS